MWHEGRQEKEEDKWRRGVRGAKAAWWKLEDLGVDRQKIRMQQSALGLMPGEGRHWTLFRWAEEPFLTAQEWKKMNPPALQNQPARNQSSLKLGKKRKLSRTDSQSTDRVNTGVRAVKRLIETVDLVFALAEDEDEEVEVVAPKKGKRKVN